ncbi:ketoacyl-synthetase C-terminal extension domain-containing protein [Streptomyces sp. M19]
MKTNIGHAEAAGGLAGLIKAVLCLEHGQVPGNLHLNTPNPRIPWDDLPLAVPTGLQPLPDTGRPAIAGVCGQGVSHLNAHVVLRQGDTVNTAARPAPGGGEAYLLPLSARTPEALAALARRYAAYLSPGGAGTRYTLRDICFSASTRRQHHAHRMAVVGTSHEELAAALAGTGGVGGRAAASADRWWSPSATGRARPSTGRSCTVPAAASCRCPATPGRPGATGPTRATARRPTTR